MDEKLSELLSHLALDNERNVESLVKMTGILSNTSPREIEEICQSLGLRSLFHCLNSSNRDEIKLASNILEKVLSTLSPTFVFNKYEEELERGLTHQSEIVRLLTVNELLRCSDNAESAELLSGNKNVLKKVVPLIADENTTVMKHCSTILVNVTQLEIGIQALFSKDVLERLLTIMDLSDVIRFRVYEIIVNISKRSEKGFERCIESHMISRLVAEVNGGDILTQLNSLELLSELARCSHGRCYLNSCGVIRNLENMLVQINSNVFSGFLEPGLIKFFGCIGHLEPKKVYTNYPIFIKKLFQLLKSNNPASSAIAIETIGLLGSSTEGKIVFANCDDMIAAMGVFASVIDSSNSDVQMKALNALECLLTLEESEQTIELISLLKTWYDAAVQHKTEKLVSLMKTPFEDVRCAAMLIIRAIARLSWAQIYINDHPGFIEYLLDRSTESSKISKELKYDIIKVLAESPTTRGIMGDIVISRLKDYVQEGPFFVKTESAVAVEGSN